MSKYLWAGALIAAALVAALNVHDLRQRVDELESAPRVDPAAFGRVDQGLAALGDQLSATRRSLEEDTTAEDLRGDLRSIEAELRDTYAQLDLQGERIQGWETRWMGRGPEQLEGRIEELRGALEQRGIELDEIAASAARIAREDRERIEALDASLSTLNLDRDLADMWHGLVGPVVQIAGESSVGSGVLLESQRIHGTDEYLTYLLTSWHVVRDIYKDAGVIADPEGMRTYPVSVKAYLEDGSAAMESATLLCYEEGLDAALLRLETTEPVEHGARIPARERLQGVRIFDPIYAVGCPLGNDPIPTAGEVAATSHSVDGGTYWMISAPTYIGNSGGGIFDAESHELLGIFTKIYTHGSVRATIVPHMGLVTPLEKIYDWFETTEYGYLAQGGPFDEAPAVDSTVAATAAR